MQIGGVKGGRIGRCLQVSPCKLAAFKGIAGTHLQADRVRKSRLLGSSTVVNAGSKYIGPRPNLEGDQKNNVYNP